MFSRFLENDYIQSFTRMIQVAYQFCRGQLQAVLVLPFSSQIRLATETRHGIKIEKVGPLLSTWHVVTVDHRLPPKQAANLLKAVMNLDESDARSHYNLINHLTSSSFFLSMNNEKALQLRQQVKSALTHQQAVINVETDRAIENVIQYLHEQPVLTNEVLLQLKYTVRNLITQSLTGLSLTPNLQSLMDRRIEGADLGFGFFPGLSYYWRLLSSRFRSMKSEFDVAIHELLEGEFKRLREDGKEEGNLLIDLIKKRYPGTRLANILRNEAIIEELIADPDIRLCISGAFAANNLASAVETGLLKLYATTIMTVPRRMHREIILDEVNAAKDSSDEGMTFPYLHAFWLETLRSAPPMIGVCRTTHHGMNVDDISIPPKSIIRLEFKRQDRQEGDTISFDHFEPIRHIHHAGYHLHAGYFTPFGLGPRMCPAQQVSELIFKKFMIAFARNIKEFGFSAITFEHEARSSPSISSNALNK